MGCDQELCANWTGDGCACAVLGIEPACGPCEAGIHEQCPQLAIDSVGLSCCCSLGDDDCPRCSSPTLLACDTCLAYAAEDAEPGVSA